MEKVGKAQTTKGNKKKEQSSTHLCSEADTFDLEVVFL